MVREQLWNFPSGLNDEKTAVCLMEPQARSSKGVDSAVSANVATESLGGAQPKTDCGIPPVSCGHESEIFCRTPRHLNRVSKSSCTCKTPTVWFLSFCFFVTLPPVMFDPVQVESARWYEKISWLYKSIKCKHSIGHVSEKKVLCRQDHSFSRNCFCEFTLEYFYAV